MKKVIVLIFLTVFGAKIYAQTTRYVKQNGIGNGSSWANASGDLQLMINNSSSGDQIWVAGGTYIPQRRMDNLGVVTLGNRQNAFVAKSGVSMYGGFAGTETQLSQRDLSNVTNKSILSGDLTQNDGVNFTNMSENSFHVIVFAGTVTNTVFDGFTIASAYYKEGVDTWDMPTVNGEVIHNHYGGSMYISNSSPSIFNIEFTKNFLHLGSGLYTQQSGTNAKFYNCIFHGNKGFYGAAMLNYFSQPEFYNVLIYDNEVLYDATISGLEGGDGGAIYNWSANPTFTNCTVVKNTASKRGGGFYNNGGTVTTRNSIVYGNVQGNTASPVWQNQVFNNNGVTVNLNNNIFQDWAGGNNGNLNATGITTSDIFQDYSANDFRLSANSIAINAGNNNFIPNITKDLSGKSRIIFDTVDLGVFERSQEFDLSVRYKNYPNGAIITDDTIQTSFIITNEGIDPSNIGDTIYVSAKINGTYFGLDLLGDKTPIILTQALQQNDTLIYNSGYLLGPETLLFFTPSTTLNICIVVWGKGIASVDFTPTFPLDVDSSNNTTCITYSQDSIVTDWAISFVNYVNSEATTNNPIDLQFSIKNNGTITYQTGDTLYVNVSINDTLYALDFTGNNASPIVLSQPLASGDTLSSTSLLYNSNGNTQNICIIIWGMGAASMSTPFFNDIDTTNNISCIISKPDDIVSIKQPLLFNNDILIYPNPADQQLTFDINESNSVEKIYITDINGRLVESLIVNDIKETIEVSNWQNGLYLCRIIFMNGFISTKKITIHK